MAKIMNADVLELFAGKQEVANSKTRDNYIAFCVCRYNPKTKTKEKIDRSIKRSDFENIKVAFTGVTRSLPFTDYLLWLLWIREVKFGMEPSLKTSDMFHFVHDAYTLCTDDTTAKAITIKWLMDLALDTLLKSGAILAEYEDRKICVTSGSGQTEIHLTATYSLTLTGKKVAERILEETEKNISAHLESDIDDSPEIYVEWKPFVIDEPDEIIVEGINSTALANVSLSQEEVEQAVYSGTLRASVNAKSSNKKFCRWAMSKTGLGHMEIARLENPEDAAQADKGNQLAKEDLESEANNIRMQVKRMDESISGKKLVKK